jgi:hypothetical protein
MEREKPDNPYEAIGFGDFGSYFKNKKIKLQLQQDEMCVAYLLLGLWIQ